MGYPTVFTLNNGVLSPLDRDGEGNRLVVDMSPLRIFPPRLALWRINEDDDGPARFPVAVRGDEDGLFINSEKECMSESFPPPLSLTRYWRLN